MSKEIGFLSSSPITFSSPMIFNILTWMGTYFSISRLSLRLPFSPGAEASEARATDLQLQAVHREVLSPHHAGRPDAERNRSCSLPADRQEHQ